jgi:hypothetical protein
MELISSGPTGERDLRARAEPSPIGGVAQSVGRLTGTAQGVGHLTADMHWQG